jgi:hypothetical protein
VNTKLRFSSTNKAKRTKTTQKKGCRGPQKSKKRKRKKGILFGLTGPVSGMTTLRHFFSEILLDKKKGERLNSGSEEKREKIGEERNPKKKTRKGSGNMQKRSSQVSSGNWDWVTKPVARLEPNSMITRETFLEAMEGVQAALKSLREEVRRKDREIDILWKKIRQLQGKSKEDSTTSIPPAGQSIRDRRERAGACSTGNNSGISTAARRCSTAISS